jgi:hypothetical protein
MEKEDYKFILLAVILPIVFGGLFGLGAWIAWKVLGS